jgi:mono/diheme cytochrome c family protein
VFVVCTLMTVACGGSAPAAQQKAGETDARQLFARACGKCHSIDGTGGLPMAANGPRPINFHEPAWQASRTDAEILAAIRDGRGAMPGFAGVLTPEEIGALTAYVRRFKSGTR